jgi:hypothetical protein
MFQQLNEFKYAAATGKNYIIYFLKFWSAGDYIIKYQIRTPDRDFFWYGRISKERALTDLKLSQKEAKALGTEELELRIKTHFQALFISVMEKGLDKGFEEPNTEFVFYNEPFVTKRVWEEEKNR